MKETDQGISRRQALKGVAALSTGGLFQIVPRHCVAGSGSKAPSETVIVAGIGAGGMGGADIRSASAAGAKIVALCDVDESRGAGVFKKFPDAKRYKDFRRLLDKEKGIDAVTVGTPDHTHATIAMDAIRRGKHVYCEKPLARTMYEVRKLTEAARKHKVATQLGNQGHSFLAMREFCECIWSGAIGDVREVHAVMGFPRLAPAQQMSRPRKESHRAEDPRLGPVAWPGSQARVQPDISLQRWRPGDNSAAARLEISSAMLWTPSSGR